MTRASYYSRRLASKAHARQADVIRRADAAADQAGAAVGVVWREVLALLRGRPHWGEAFRRAAQLFQFLHHLPRQRTADALARVARWGHRSAAADMAQALPVRLMLRAAEGRMAREPLADVLDVRRGLRERRHGRGPGRVGVVAVREDEGPAAPVFTLADLLAAFREGPLAARPAAVLAGLSSHASAAEVKALLAKLLFPAPSPELVRRVVYAGGWQERLAASTRLAAPETLANLLAGGIAAGKTPQQIARDLLPAVEGVRSTARRVARTEALRVAGVMQRDCHRGLGDLQIGWELKATHDRNSRPWHAAREGRRYYFEPGPGQNGLDRCPFPPDEPADPNERPAKAPKIAFN